MDRHFISGKIILIMSFPSHHPHEQHDDAVIDNTLARPQVGISRIASTLNRPRLSVNEAKDIINNKMADQTTWRTRATPLRQVVRRRPRIVPSTWSSLTRRLNVRTHTREARVELERYNHEWEFDKFTSSSVLTLARISARL